MGRVGGVAELGGRKVTLLRPGPAGLAGDTRLGVGGTGVTGNLLVLRAGGTLQPGEL